MLARGALVAALAATAAAPVRAQADREFLPIRNWDQDEDGAKVEALAETLLLRSGTIRTSIIYTDFVLRFDYRVAKPDARGELLVRAGTGRDGALRAYGIALEAGPDRGRLSGIGRTVDEAADGPAGPPALAPPGDWTSCEVRFNGRELRVFLDDAEVSRAERLETRPGYVAFTARDGALELRGIRIAMLDPEGSDFPAWLPRTDDAGINAPRIAHKEPLLFPPGAMRAGATGVVVLQFVVEADGRPGPMRVIKGPHPDLALAAMECLQRWRFTPATKDGMPTAVVATMEVAFALGTGTGKRR